MYDIFLSIAGLSLPLFAFWYREVVPHASTTDKALFIGTALVCVVAFGFLVWRGAPT